MEGRREHARGRSGLLPREGILGLCTACLGVLALAGCGGRESREPVALAAARVESAERWIEENSQQPAGAIAAGLAAVRADARGSGVLLGGGPDDGTVRSPRDVLDAMRKRGAIDRGASEALVEEARRHRMLGELAEAEVKLEQALALWSGNEEAQKLLDEVGLLLGDTRSATRRMSEDIRAQLAVERELLRFEARRLLNQAAHHIQREEFAKAIESYQRAIDGIRHAPFDLGLEGDLAKAQQGLVKAQEAEKAKKFAADQAFRDMRAKDKQREEREAIRYLENHIRALRRQAVSAAEEEDFDRAARLYGEILDLNPHDVDAAVAQRVAKERDHLQTMDRLMRSSMENFRKAVLAIEESSVVYQEIFRYPDKDEWERISPKVVTIEEQVEKFQSPLEDAVRRRLAQPITYGLEEPTPLRVALNDLQSLTQVNFFLADSALGDTEVELETLTNEPLRTVLGWLLRKAGDAGYVIRDGAVVIAQDQAQLEEPKFLRFYDVSDLITKRPDFPAPQGALDDLQGRGATDVADISLDIGGTEDTTGEVYGKEELLALIARELNPRSGDPAATEEVEGIRIHGNGKLMALVTLDKHLKLATILERFRKATGMMVTVESRFLDIQDNYLEEIGINFGSGNTTFLPNRIPDIDGEGTQVSPGYEFIDARGQFNLRAATIGALSNPIGSQINPFNISGEGGGAYQLNVLDAERFQLEALLTGVAKEQEIRRLNSPRVTAFNTQTAHTLVISQAAYIQDLEVNQTGVVPVMNPVIGVLNTGSILEVRPTISYDRKFVVLEIQPTLSEQIGLDVAILNLSDNLTVVPVQLPIVSVTKIKTTVNVPDGGTVLLGGLKREITSDASIGLPALRRLPVVNLFFGRKGTSALRSNLFVLINAKITVVHEEEARLFGTGI